MVDREKIPKVAHECLKFRKCYILSRRRVVHTECDSFNRGEAGAVNPGGRAGVLTPLLPPFGI